MKQNERTSLVATRLASVPVFVVRFRGETISGVSATSFNYETDSAPNGGAGSSGAFLGRCLGTAVCVQGTCVGIFLQSCSPESDRTLHICLRFAWRFDGVQKCIHLDLIAPFPLLELASVKGMVLGKEGFSMSEYFCKISALLKYSI